MAFLRKLWLLLPLVPSTAAAAGTAAADEPEIFAIHGQITYVEQQDSNFAAPYSGPNSLTPDRAKETVDANISIGRALWPGAEIWVTPEIDQGFGLNNTLGIAGFPSGEAYKVGDNQAYFRVPRLFVRDTVNGDGDPEAVPATANGLAGNYSVNRWVITLGKFAVTDIFDCNEYAHDPRADFLNWTAIDAAAFDYAADAWGYSVGAAAERYQGPWTWRAGIFDLSDVPNSKRLDPGFGEFQIILETEHRLKIGTLPGKIIVTAFDSRGRMGLLNEAVQLAESTGAPVDIAQVRQYRSRLGAVLNLEQQLAGDLGMFARISKAAGNVEPYEFTDVDRSVAGGLSLKGSAWHRSADTLGVALIDNGISADRERYLNAGGLGILVGDGKLPHPAAEEILETYYSVAVLPGAQLTLDYQWVDHPAYNTDRGPVSVFALRLHAQF